MVTWTILRRDKRHVYVCASYENGTTRNVRMSAERKTPEEIEAILKRRTPSPSESRTVELGDLVEQALTSVGVTKERVERWLGRPCGCEGRRKKLNALSKWARQTVNGVFKSPQWRLNRLLKHKRKRHV